MSDGWSPEELVLLGRTPLFLEVPEITVRKAAENPACHREVFGREAVIYSPEHFRRCLGVLLHGRARVTKGPLVVSVLEAGALFGAAALFHQRARYETTITALSTCTVALFPGGAGHRPALGGTGPSAPTISATSPSASTS